MARMVLFDIDGTLIHTGGAGRTALDRAFATEWGVEEAYRDYDFTGKVDTRILRDAFVRYVTPEPTPDDFARARAAYLRHLGSELEVRRDQYLVLPGIEPLLGRLQELGTAVGLATGNLYDGARMKLEFGDLWRYFPFGGFGSDHEHRGELTRLAIARGEALVGESIPPAEVVVIGDSPLDVQAAHYCGARALAVMTGWSERAAIAALSPEHLLDDLSDTDAVLRLLGSDNQT